MAPQCATGSCFRLFSSVWAKGVYAICTPSGIYINGLRIVCFWLALLSSSDQLADHRSLADAA